MPKLELWKPLDTWHINQKFGEDYAFYHKNFGINGHNGLDLQATDGQVVRASHDGVVIEAMHDTTGGLGIVIATLEQFTYNGIPSYFKTIYWHLKEGSIKVKLGQRVLVGDVIAEADNTGLSTGTHLHFGLKAIVHGVDGWSWKVLNENNGFLGAIDPLPCVLPWFAKDERSVITIFTQMISALTQLVTNAVKGK